MNTNMPVYYVCNMKKRQHIAIYLLSSILASMVAYIFYHILSVSLVAGFIMGIFLEKLYSKSTIKKRQKKLRLQFRDFLEAMAVAARAGNVEVQAIRFAAKDLRMSYTQQSDIVREIDNILVQYEGGGVAIKDLFQDFANRNRLADVQNFATIYGVIEGKSDRFGDIVVQTHEIIGEKIEVEQEIETGITSAKSETYMMLVMPIVVVGMMSALGGGLLDAAFTTMAGHLAATVALILFAVSFVMAIKFTDIEV